MDGAPFDEAELLAKAIWEARVAAHLSQQALADYLGVSIGTVKRWEAGEEASIGKTLPARRSTAILVAEATGRRDLLGLSEPEPTEVDQMKKALAELMETVARQAAELVALQRAQEGTRTRVERLEHGGAGTGT